MIEMRPLFYYALDNNLILSKRPFGLVSQTNIIHRPNKDLKEKLSIRSGRYDKLISKDKGYWEMYYNVIHLIRLVN